MTFKVIRVLKAFSNVIFFVYSCAAVDNTPRAVLRDRWDSCCCGNRTEGLFTVTYTSSWFVNKIQLLQICNWEWYPTATLPSTFSEFQGYFSYPFWNATHIHSVNQWQVTDRWKSVHLRLVPAANAISIRCRQDSRLSSYTTSHRAMDISDRHTSVTPSSRTCMASASRQVK